MVLKLNEFDSNCINDSYEFDSNCIKDSYEFDSNCINDSYEFDSNCINDSYEFDSNCINDSYEFDSNCINDSYEFWFLNFVVTAPAGFPDHPHRGLEFECVISSVHISLIHCPNFVFNSLRWKQDLRQWPTCYRYAQGLLILPLSIVVWISLIKLLYENAMLKEEETKCLFESFLV